MTKTAVRTFFPAIVLAAAIAVWVFGAATASPGRNKVIIGFDRPPGATEEALVRGLGGSIKYTYALIPAIAAEIPEEALAALERNPNVAYVEEDLPRRVHDDELDNSWGVNRIDAEVVHATNKGAGVKVGIIDTGIDCTHPDLNDNCEGGYDFFNDDASPIDDYGHGTHVAGTVAAEDDNADLLNSHPGVVGVAPAADLYALKVCSSGGSCPTSDIVAALEWASGITPEGVTVPAVQMHVVNISLGSRFPSTAERLATEAAYNAGVLVVASAGNSGNCGGNNDRVEFPAGYDSVIAVGATNKDDLRPCFSSTGPAVELAGPGVGVLSTVPAGDCRLCTSTGYREGTGTSMASPHVAGTAALIVASGIADAGGDGFINDDVRQRLAGTADDLGDPGRDIRYGYGLVDAENAVLGTPNGDNLPPPPTPTATPTSTPEEATATPTPTPEEATATPTPTPGAAGTMHVGDLDGSSQVRRNGSWRASVLIAVHDADDNPVGNATVTVSWSAGKKASSSCTTNGSGSCTVRSGTIPPDQTSVTATVTGVTDSLTYDSTVNHDPDGDSNGTFITVVR